MAHRFGEWAFSAFMAASLAVFGIGLLPLILFGPDVARLAPRTWSRVNLWALRHLTGVSHQIVGPENIPTGPAIVAANHQSAWETLALYAILPKPAAVLKKELLRIPVYGWWLRATGNLVIDREGGAKALRAIRKDAAARLAEGCQIIVFPEGTRTPPGETALYHPGIAGIVAASDAPCVPVAHDSGRFWRHPGQRKSPGVITLKFLEPMAPIRDRREFLRELKSRIEAARPDLDREAFAERPAAAASAHA